jgi:hypothetical protein
MWPTASESTATHPSFGPIERHKWFFPDLQPMRVSGEPVCIYLFMLNPIFISLHLRSPVHVASPLIFYSADRELRSLKRPLASVPPLIYSMAASLVWSTSFLFVVPAWGDKVNSGIGLSYRPERLHMLAGRYDNPMLESTVLSISHSQRLYIWLQNCTLNHTEAVVMNS